MRPTREHATHNGQTYFVTSSTWGKRGVFQTDRCINLFLEILYCHRHTSYLLHEFVLMRDPFHLLITPKESLEKSVQFIKGGFSYRAKKDFGIKCGIWQKGFSDHRIRDAFDYLIHRHYIFNNPVKKYLCERAEDYAYSSANGKFDLDSPPRRLKPCSAADNGAAEAAPLQTKVAGAGN